MLDILRKEIKVSDKVKLYLTSGKEVEVDILEIGDRYILVKNADGSQSRFFEPLIGGWDLLKEEFIKELVNENDTSDITGKNAQDQTDEKHLGLKIIGKIDLGKIESGRKRFSSERRNDVTMPDLASQPKTLVQHIKAQNQVFTSLEGLQELKDKMILENSEQLVPANAVIKKYFNSYDYGYVTDKEGKDYKFNLSDIVDPLLKEEINNINISGKHVVCATKDFYGKSFAWLIYYPRKIETFQSIAESFYKKENYAEACAILNLILNTSSDFEPAIKLKNKILAAKNKKKTTSVSSSSTYLQAKIELKRGNVEYAKRLLLELVENPNVKSETALKELSYELQREGKLEDAIQLVSKYKSLIKTSDPNSLLAYFYEVKKDYASAIVYLKMIKTRTSIEKNRLEKRFAIGYFQLKDYTKSEEYLRKILKDQPNDYLIKRQLELLEKIKLDGFSDEIESIFSEAELSSLTGGRSPHIQFAIENCDYSGVPATIISEEKFTKTTLKELRRLIEEAGKARPKERAPYLLTEAKLMEKLEPEKEIELNSVIARYCLAVSQNLASENHPVDVVRFYLLEAFKYSSSFDVISNHIPIYVNSFKLSPFESFKRMQQPIDEMIKGNFSNENNNSFWVGITDLFLTNTEIFSQLLTRLFQNQTYQRSCLSFLSEYLDTEQIQTYDKEGFSNFWNEAVDKRRRGKEAFSSKFLSLGKNKTTEAFSEAFNLAKASIPDWLGYLDKHRVNSFDDILKTLYEFNSQIAFEDKERYFNIVGSQIVTLKSEIETSPTEFSFNILRSQLEFLNNLVEQEFRTVIQTSRPIITVKVLGESIVNENNLVTSSINISNKKGSAPISWFLLEINNSDNIKICQENNENNQSLKGGDDKTLKLKVQVSKEIAEQGAFNLNVKLSYKIRGSEDVLFLNENLAIRLYSESEFDEIPNPFAATADSGPVQDEKMFYGRDEFIENIKKSVLESSSKCVIIYGQKRSGKSSVLFHLKKQLNQSTNAFCISFSLGEIVEDLSAQTFYYKILSEIEDSLEVISVEEGTKPIFIAPSLSELKEAPSIIFNDYMKKFRKECSLNSKWKNKHLVLLIDEFTYIYTAIQKGFLSDQFMKTWKSFVEKSYFTSILIGQDIMPKFKMAYQNEFGISEDKRLSYLSKEDSIKLIEEPVWDKRRNRTRYLGKALDVILDYTSSNPYYIQIFCARLVEYMNNQKAISITEADVYDVAQTFIKGEQSLNADKFDNLITAGDADVESFNPQDTLRALREIAYGSKNLDSCSRDSIKLGDKVIEEQIISDLKTREVISSPQQDFYKIKVRIFKEWLLNN